MWQKLVIFAETLQSLPQYLDILSLTLPIFSVSSLVSPKTCNFALLARNFYKDLKIFEIVARHFRFQLSIFDLSIFGPVAVMFV